MSSVVLVSFARTPIGSLSGSLSQLLAPKLGSAAIAGALSKIGGVNALESHNVEVILGNVVSAGVGQAPARQAAKAAGLPNSTQCTTLNKVCASGMKSAMYGASSIMLGSDNVVIAGGFESMSRIPHYMMGGRVGEFPKLGNATLTDGLVHDGLWDVYNNQHMGMCAEKCADDYGISKADQDEYAVESYKRAAKASAGEIPPKRRGGDSTYVKLDEEINAVNLEKLPGLRPAFKREGGTVTAANASSINDGGAAMVLMSEEKAKAMNLTPLARITGFGDFEQAPEDFTTAPAGAVPNALKMAKMSLADVDYHEINEAFSVVALANMKLMDLDASRVNVNGGAVSLGHPIGCSGARIIGSLYSVLSQNDGAVGCASICNGGGGASAIVIERLS
ncbi:hypothetical protein ScalyP_jg11980 [Parmales sp. scaly parma]|nr:hypothetical protein ScalyP_jg11980 [Parmales sp. scaly parma]